MTHSQSVSFWANPFSTFRQDALSSIVVFLVSLPLCLGIAMATGYPPEAGIISGVIGGLLVGLFTGCPLQVSGPAAGLITLVWEAQHTLGFQGLGVAIFIGGLLQIGMGVLGLGLWFRAVSPAVVQGMLAGIGVLIFSSQFHVMVDDVPKASSLQNLLTIPGAIQKGVFPLDGSVHHLAAVVGLTAITTIVLWNMMPKTFKMVPAPLVAVVSATLITAIFQFPINHVVVPDDLLSSLHMFRWNPLTQSFFTNSQVWVVAASIAFIASAETLLTATAVDQMAAQAKANQPRTLYNREVMAQGIGNVAAGLLGVLPITGVIVRSSANVQAGGKSQMATLLHGVWLLLFVLLAPFLLERIPVAALAAILVYTGYKLVDVQAIKKLASYSRFEVVIYVVTVVAIVLTNLLEGVLIGLGLALLKHVISHSQLTVHTETRPNDHAAEILVVLKGSASFVTLPRLASAIEALPENRDVYVQFDALAFIDHACVEFLKEWQTRYELQGGRVVLEWGNIVLNRSAGVNAESVKSGLPQTISH